jgi:hypothetical protein
MDMSMTIEEFNALLTSESEKDDSPLLTALRKLTTIEKPEDITALADDFYTWTDWATV